jgi:ketosteroid isomerase-like protein
MQRSAVVLMAALSAATLAHAEEAGSHLDSLVDAERAFSALSVEQGMKSAFIANLADDGILFRPGPVNGRDLWKKRPNPPGTLIWEPSYAEVSALGDLGVSTGPWEFRPPEGSGDAKVGHGHFVSIWERGERGPWKVAVDLGISHPRPERGIGAVDFEAGPEHRLPRHDEQPKRLKGISFGFGMSRGGVGVGVGAGTEGLSDDDRHRIVAHEVNRMMTAERTLAFEIRGKGPGRAYPKVATQDVRTYREGAPPTVGITPAIEADQGKPAAEFVPFGKGMAEACDMGYSYGLALRKPKGSSRADTTGYLHVWRLEAEGEWKLSLDIESAFPKR